MRNKKTPMMSTTPRLSEDSSGSSSPLGLKSFQQSGKCSIWIIQKLNPAECVSPSVPTVAQLHFLFMQLPLWYLPVEEKKRLQMLDVEQKEEEMTGDEGSYMYKGGYICPVVCVCVPEELLNWCSPNYRGGEVKWHDEALSIFVLLLFDFFFPL